MIVGIQNEILRIRSLGFLKKLLEDKTTKTNIIWATDAYGERGRSYESNQEVQIELITGVHSDIIKNRAQKELEHQAERTKQHAEVFTPLWICKQMETKTNVKRIPDDREHYFMEYLANGRFNMCCSVLQGRGRIKPDALIQLPE